MLRSFDVWATQSAAGSRQSMKETPACDAHRELPVQSRKLSDEDTYSLASRVIYARQLNRVSRKSRTQSTLLLTPSTVHENVSHFASYRTSITPPPDYCGSARYPDRTTVRLDCCNTSSCRRG
jgi:hypothetical protein